MLTVVTASTSLTPEMLRGPVLSSSPAVAYPSTVPFQYSAFPFESNFSLPSISNSFSSVSTLYMDSSSSSGPLCMPSQTQLVGPNGVVSMSYRPYFKSLPGGSSNVGLDGRKWGSQGIDLNAGPGIDDKSL
ncbi:Bromo adjacent homology (BAH) domain-containing protein [Artemisia annua]|uniref:Bromo adjacent homology (BAH) domain-containing protein n=1 Tax=Artemisia annua TaxID=35608 RepID=A0A2U1LQK3_ARTAN|nr:Bromo adjacent homology (BAH) domain-containing protein [Artemisia annua]